MNKKIIQRKWALIVAILLTTASIRQLISNDLANDTYGSGQLVAFILLPIIFYILAFKKKKEKSN